MLIGIQKPIQDSQVQDSQAGDHPDRSSGKIKSLERRHEESRKVLDPERWKFVYLRILIEGTVR